MTDIKNEIVSEEIVESKTDKLIGKITCGDCVDIMTNQMDAESVDMVLCSPPYGQARDYNGFVFDYKTTINSLYKIMKTGGVVVWVIADQTVKGSETGDSFRQALFFLEKGFLLHDTMIFQKNTSSWPAQKTGARYSSIFEYMFVFSKNQKPNVANLLCDKQNHCEGLTNFKGAKTDRQKDGTLIKKADIKPVPKFSPRNNIWPYIVSGNIGNNAEAYSHPATFPIALARDHLKTWSNEGDIVCDIMAGSGTTLLAAKELKRKWIGIDVSQEYCNLMKKRLGII